MTTIKKTILNTASCSKCNKGQTLLELGVSLDKKHLSFFLNTKFLENKTYTNLGLFYIESLDLTAIGPFGSNRLNIKCKTANCENNIIELEDILKQI
jgi:glutaredoxin